MNLGLHTTSMTTKKNFGQKNFLTPQGVFCTQKTPFWLKNGLLNLYLPNAAIIFSNFGIKTTLMVSFEKIIVYMPGKF